MPETQKAKKAREEAEKVRQELRKRTLSYITAGLGLVAGLAWNDAISSLINAIFPGVRGTVFAKFIYAVLITASVVILGMVLARIFRKEEKEGS